MGEAFDVPGSGDDGVPVDLARPSIEPWGSLAVPRGWREVARVARAVAEDVDGLADRIVDCIHEEIPAYRPGAVPTDDVHASVVSTVRMILLGVAEHRGPTADEVAVRRELGARRARQGLPVDAVIQAFHVGSRELWLALARALPEDAPRATAQLLTAATTVWGWIHQVTDAISAAHGATVRRLEARVIGARQRFIELLVAGDLDGDEAERLGHALGFDTTASFSVAVVSGASDDADAIEVQRRVEDLPGQHAVVARGPLMVLVTQAADTVAVRDATRAVVPAGTSARGLSRRGLRGARESLVDAELALALAVAGTDETFEAVWLWATLRGADERLRDVLATGADVADRHPHLAEAVLAFGDHGFSVSEAARRLTIHANTVGYRLDRWNELTGWDARTFDGLVRSLAALRLGRD